MAIGNRVKGITIEFNGDTTKLNRALGDVNKKTKSVDQSLKEINRALKFNPGNTELLAQKQTLLKQRVDETKDKLQLLKKAQEELDKDPSVDNTSQDYMELRREIIETESKLKHFEEEAKKLDNIKFEKIGKQIQNVGDKMKNVGEGMTKYVTAPLAGGAGAAVAAFKEVDSGMDIIVKKTGATGDALDAMKDSAKNLAKSIPTDFETAGAAIGEVKTRFRATGQELEDLSGKFIKFAELNDTDVSDSVDKVQKAMEAFEMPASEAGNMLDILNKVGQDTGISMDKLEKSLVANAPQLKAMGFNATQAATFVGQLEKSGIDSNKAMTGLNKAIVNGAKEGKTLPQVMDDIQTSIVGASNETDAMNAAVEIFGAKAGPAIATAARNGALDFQALANSALDASGSVENTFDETLDPADKFTMMLNNLKVTGYEVGGTILELVTPALEKFAIWLKNVTDKWKEMDPQTQQFIIKAAGIVAVAGPVITILGGIVGKVGLLITHLPTLIGAFSKVSSVVGIASKAFTFMTGPVGAIILAIGAAIAIGVLLYKNWDKIKEKAGALKDWIVSKFTAMKDGVKKIFGSIKDAMVKPIEKAKDLIKGIIDKIKGFLSFKFQLPKIKLPHFAINPKGWNLGDLLEGVIPSLGINWYAKGAIFKKPIIVGNSGFGEAGAEAAVPLDPFWDRLDQISDRIVEAVRGDDRQPEDAVFQGNIVVDGQVIARVVTPIINRSMQKQAVLDGRNA
ncbi:MAG: phage tail tape measure protein [Lachnospiraceae bacterium]|nr:phage tail tape measure protein [Lachnospiraceae bacterium]